MNIPDLSLTEPLLPIPYGVSLAYVIVVERCSIFPKIAVHLRHVCTDGETITVLP